MGLARRQSLGKLMLDMCANIHHAIEIEQMLTHVPGSKAKGIGVKAERRSRHKLSFVNHDSREHILQILEYMSDDF